MKVYCMLNVWKRRVNSSWKNAFMVWWFTIETINIHTASAHIICDLCCASNISWSHTCKFMQLLILRVPACRFNSFKSFFLFYITHTYVWIPLCTTKESVRILLNSNTFLITYFCVNTYPFRSLCSNYWSILLWFIKGTIYFHSLFRYKVYI